MSVSRQSTISTFDVGDIALSGSHTVDTGAQAVVCIVGILTTGGTATPTPSVGGNDMTLVSSHYATTLGGAPGVETWVLLSPPTGSQTVASAAGGFRTFTFMNVTSGGSAVTATDGGGDQGENAHPTLGVTAATGDLVIDGLRAEVAESANTPAGDNTLINHNTSGNGATDCSDAPGAASVSMAWTMAIGTEKWAQTTVIISESGDTPSKSVTLPSAVTYTLDMGTGLGTAVDLRGVILPGSIEYNVRMGPGSTAKRQVLVVTGAAAAEACSIVRSLSTAVARVSATTVWVDRASPLSAGDVALGKLAEARGASGWVDPGGATPNSYAERAAAYLAGGYTAGGSWEDPDGSVPRDLIDRALAVVAADVGAAGYEDAAGDDVGGSYRDRALRRIAAGIS